MEEIIADHVTDMSDTVAEAEHEQQVRAPSHDAPPVGPGFTETDTPPSPPRFTPPTATAVARKLVLFSDGTGNSSAKAEKTNVWRMFQALDLTTSDQLAIYDDGVGSSANKYLAAIGGALGVGLKRNVIDLYKFVCRNHVGLSTEIYGFGFSRGAFTIRVLLGLITSEGLVNFTSERELHERAIEAYGEFRRKCFKPAFLSPVHLYRLVRQAVASIVRRSARRPTYAQRPRREVERIKFIGLWDTVSAYGMPIAELKPAINWLFWPMHFSDLKLSDKVERACHALSLDDERTTFHPIVWDETEESDQKRITQVWFAGVHANVGGGYPEDQLSLVSLDWMMRQAKENGLLLQDSCIERISHEKSSFGRIYNARAGLGVFYRYSPREITVPCDRCELPVMPIIHSSVIARMARGADAYVPNWLPPYFLVLAPNGELLPMEGFKGASVPAVSDYIDAATRRTPQILDTTIADQRTDALKKAIQELPGPDRESFELILDTVWWRRVTYLVSSLLATLIVLYPWIGEATDIFMGNVRTLAEPIGIADVWDKFNQLDEELIGMTTTFLESVSGFIPTWFDPWTETIQQHPLEVAALVALFVAALQVGELLRRRLHDIGLLAWHTALRKPFRASLLETLRNLMRRSLHLLVIFDAAFLALAVHEATKDHASRYYVAAAILNIVVLARIELQRRQIRTLGEQRRDTEFRISKRSVTERVRTNKVLGSIYRWIGDGLLPAVFGAALVYLVAVGVNRMAFDLASGSGRFCQSTLPDNDTSTVNKSVGATSLFNTNNFCWSSGRALAAKTRYRIVIEDTAGDWFDRKTPTDPRGFRANNVQYALATPLKRWWREPWFAPIARVGKKGNQEYALQPCVFRYRDTPKNGSEFLSYTQQIDEKEALELKLGIPTPEERKVLVAEFTPQFGGELFLFVNDAVLAIPGHGSFFYKNNRGTATVTIEQIHDDAASKYHAFCPK